MTLRKFECCNCHRRFEADDHNKVECPHCQSDNVDYAHFHLPKGWWKWGLGIAACIVLGYVLFVASGLLEPNSSRQKVETEDKNATSVVEENIDTAIVEDLKDLPVSPTVNIVGNPTYENGSYTFAVSVKNAPPEGSYYVVALDHFDHSKVIAKSIDGKFENLPPSEAKGGLYDFAVCAKTNDSLLCNPVPRAGFIPQKAVTRRMSKEELQHLIDSNDDSLYGAGENDYIAPDCELIYEDLPSEVSNAPTKLYEVADKVDMRIWHVAVTNIEYDDMNKVSVVHLKIDVLP